MAVLPHNCAESLGLTSPARLQEALRIAVIFAVPFFCEYEFAGLVTQWEDQLSGDAHLSFNTRIDSMYDTINGVCQVSADMKAACDAYKSRFHPTLPAFAPLSLPPRARTESRRWSGPSIPLDPPLKQE